MHSVILAAFNLVFKLDGVLAKKLCNCETSNLGGKEKRSKFKARKSRAKMLSWRTLKQRGMLRNKEFGLFAKPLKN
jgi:hypothetical protein